MGSEWELTKLRQGRELMLLLLMANIHYILIMGLGVQSSGKVCA
jgi:hypothetical protein